MESGIEPSQYCDCECHSSHRSVKRKLDESETQNRFSIPELDGSSNPKVDIENECELLRETVTNQQQSIQDLYEEIEKERNAASSAADESMNVMQRLQNEKAELQMELRQYKLYVGEKMEHDLQEILALEEMLNQREEMILALTCEAQGYKHRMLSYGVTTEREADGGDMSLLLSSKPSIDCVYEYPSLKCKMNEKHDHMESDIYVDDDDGHYPPADSPHGREHLRSLDWRISQMEETNPSFTHLDARGRESPSSSSHLGASKEVRHEAFVESPRSESCSYKKVEHVSCKENGNAKGGSFDIGDEMNDRVYTIDSVHHSGVTEEKLEAESCDGNVVSSHREQRGLGGDPDITKLYMRLQALEADRESMKQALVSMRTEKAQMVLLKEIAQHLSKEVVPQRRLPLRKASTAGSLTFTPVFKWISSFVSWRRKARRSKYMYGMSANTMGLQMLLEKVPRSRKWRCLRSTQV